MNEEDIHESFILQDIHTTIFIMIDLAGHAKRGCELLPECSYLKGQLETYLENLWEIHNSIENRLSAIKKELNKSCGNY